MKMNFKVNETSTKLRGGYYTPLPIAQFLSEWVMEMQPHVLLEPSCGDGIFLKALKDLDSFEGKITACEIDPCEVEKSKRAARDLRLDLTIYNVDFLEWAIKKNEQGASFDAIVGNPPFIRYQYLDPEVQARAEKIFATHQLPFTKHTNLWVSVIIASISLLKAGGRLGMVVPSEILHVLHAQSLRDFLLRECEDICLIDPEELWFEDALQGVMLLLLTKKSHSSLLPASLKIIPVKDNEFLENRASILMNNFTSISGEIVTNKKWMIGLLSDRERALLIKLADNKKIVSFNDVAEIDVGIVTGANDFFLVNDETVEKFKLNKWAHPMYGRSEHVPGVIYDESVHDHNAAKGLPTNFLWFKELKKDAPKKVWEYIKEGEAQGLDERYKCRIRTPWYVVPSVHSSPVGMLKRSHDFPRLILNKANAFTTDTAYRVYPKKNVAERMVFSFLNSLTALSAELEGRHYGGGVLELVPSEIKRVLLPDPHYILSVQIEELDKSMRKKLRPQDLLSEQDRMILKPLGISTQICDELRNAWNKLRSRRHREPVED